MRVAGEKLAQAQRLGGMPRPQQNYVSQTAADQRDAAKDEGAHEDFAQLCVARDQSSQVAAAHLQEFAGLCNAAAHQAAAARDHGHFPGKLSGIVVDDQPLGMAVGLHNFHAPRQQHKKGNVGIARLEENIARFYVSHPAQGADAADLLRGQHGESLSADLGRHGFYLVSGERCQLGSHGFSRLENKRLRLVDDSGSGSGSRERRPLTSPAPLPHLRSYRWRGISCSRGRSGPFPR